MISQEICYDAGGNGGGGIPKETPPPFERLSPTLQVAFGQLFDYAGFAPPARTAPAQVLKNFDSDRKGPHAGMLHTLVQRAVYLDKKARHQSDFEPLRKHSNRIDQVNPWPISVVFPTDPQQDVNLFNYGHLGMTTLNDIKTITIDSAEVPAQSAESVHRIVDRLASPGRQTYIEVPLGEQTGTIMKAIAQHKDEGVFAKLRTGDDNPPSFEQTADFMIKAAQLDLGYKLTGRLHGLVAHTVHEKRKGARLLAMTIQYFLAVAHFGMSLPRHCDRPLGEKQSLATCLQAGRDCRVSAGWRILAMKRTN